MAVKKHKLETNVGLESFAIGLVCSESEFQLILKLNTSLQAQLKVNTAIQQNQATETVNFPVFSSADADHEKTIYLVKAKEKGTSLLKQLKTFDYFLLVSGQSVLKLKNNTLQKIKDINNIVIASPLDEKQMQLLVKLTSDIITE